MIKDYFFTFFMAQSNTLIADMLKNAVHIGSRKANWSPKMADYIYGEQNGVHVFDLYKTAESIDAFCAALKELCLAGKEVLIVGTKVQVQDMVRDVAESTGHHYIVSSWVPGLLTNFVTIKRRINDYNRLTKQIESGELDSLGKKEKAMEMRKYARLKRSYEGLKNIKRKPDAVLVVDGFYESLALREARSIGISTFAFLGTTGDVDGCDHCIAANCNAIKSVQFLLDTIKPALKK